MLNNFMVNWSVEERGGKMIQRKYILKEFNCSRANLEFSNSWLVEPSSCLITVWPAITTDSVFLSYTYDISSHSPELRLKFIFSPSGVYTIHSSLVLYVAR